LIAQRSGPSPAFIIRTIAVREAGMRRALVAVAAVVLASTLAGSAAPVGPAEYYEQFLAAQEHKQVRDILARWEAGYSAAKKPVFVPTFGLMTKLTGPGALENYHAIMDGHSMVAIAPLPAEATGPSELRWPDGSTRPVTALTADQTLSALQDESH